MKSSRCGKCVMTGGFRKEDRGLGWKLSTGLFDVCALFLIQIVAD